MLMSAYRCPKCDHINLAQALQCVSCDARLDEIIEPPVDFWEKIQHYIETPNQNQVLGKQEPSIKPSPSLTGVNSYEQSPQEMLSDNTLPTICLETMSDFELPQNFGSAYARTTLILSDEERGIEFSIPAEELEEVIIGRENRLTGFSPRVDLALFSGHNLGVSRYHASIRSMNDVLLLADHNSRNGTYLNGKRLVSQQEQVIYNGDLIRIGKLNFLVKY
jgi:FHA domain-containing protein